jgi:hypothetical protein
MVPLQNEWFAQWSNHMFFNSETSTISSCVSHVNYSNVTYIIANFT